jgi:hypothetical protein
MKAKIKMAEEKEREVEILTVFKYKGYNFFIHSCGEDKVKVSHLETGYAVGRAYIFKKCKKIESTINKAKRIMARIPNSKLKLIIDSQMSKEILNTIDFFL